MVQFKNFELKNSELVFGGDLIPCTWTDGTNSGTDMIDTERQRIVYREN